MAGIELIFISNTVTVNNVPTERIRIKEITEESYIYTFWDVDTCLIHTFYNRINILSIIKKHMFSSRGIKYTLYGTLFIDYIFELNPNLNVYL